MLPHLLPKGPISHQTGLFCSCLHWEVNISDKTAAERVIQAWDSGKVGSSGGNGRGASNCGTCNSGCGPSGEGCSAWGATSVDRKLHPPTNPIPSLNPTQIVPMVFLCRTLMHANTWIMIRFQFRAILMMVMDLMLIGWPVKVVQV